MQTVEWSCGMDKSMNHLLYQALDDSLYATLMKDRLARFKSDQK